jgi:hypothetical protein
MSSKPSWEQISRVFDKVLDKPSAEKAPWIAMECEGDAALLKEVEELLALMQAEATGIEPRAGDMASAVRQGLS